MGHESGEAVPQSAAQVGLSLEERSCKAYIGELQASHEQGKVKAARRKRSDSGNQGRKVIDLGAAQILSISFYFGEHILEKIMNQKLGKSRKKTYA